MSRRAISLNPVKCGSFFAPSKGNGTWQTMLSTFQRGPELLARFLSALSATIALLEARLLMLDRVIRDEEDAGQLWSSVNDGPHQSENDDQDVALREWSARHAIKKAREELKRAKARRAHEKDRAARKKAGGS